MAHPPVPPNPDQPPGLPQPPPAGPRPLSGRLAPTLRLGWGVLSAFIVESTVFALAVLPAVLFWQWHFGIEFPAEWVRILVLSMSLIPAYLLSAFSFMALSAGAMRLLGWRTPPDAEMRIVDFEWPLLDWGRYLVSTHLVRIFAGTLFRATPVWSFYLQLNGARLGKGVFVNSLSVNDHNLLDFGDHVVIGEHAHVSGHTVEHGYVKTARVRIGSHVTVGLQAVIGIGVQIGDHVQIGALSLVPKYSRLPGGATYVGIPVRPLAGPDAGGPAPRR